MKKRECAVCKGEIKDNEDYFKVELFTEGKLKRTDHAHRICWMNRNNFNDQLSDLVKGVSNFATNNGFIPKKEIEVII